MKNINWKLISNAVEFYQDHGFKYIETPWFVSLEALEITCEKRSNIYRVAGKGGLVGSAEQAFLQLSIDNQLEGVNFVSAGPCFRNERVDDLHQNQFFKVELFTRCVNSEESKFAAWEVLKRAEKFMGDSATVVETQAGWDIEINGIEVGSYGRRYHDAVGWWVYGTGIAEPRYTQALQNTSV